MDAIRWRECAGRLDSAAIGTTRSHPSAAHDQNLQVSELAALHIAELVTKSGRRRPACFFALANSHCYQLLATRWLASVLGRELPGC